MKIRNRIVALTLAAFMAGAAAISPLSDSFVQEAAVARAEEQEKIQILNLSSTWKYLDDNTDPAGTGERTSWTRASFDDSGWKTNGSAQAKFGVKNGVIADLGGGCTPTVLLNQYIGGDSSKGDIPAFFFRTTFDLTSIPDNMDLTGTLKYDDAAILYLNGEKIASFDEPEGGFESNLSYVGSNAGNPKEVTFTIDTGKLKTGENVLAVEIHQGRASSSDLYFEMSDFSLVKKDEPTQKAVSLTVGADETSRNITWYFNGEDAGKVQYAVKNGDEFPAQYQSADATAAATNDAGFYSNQAILANLAPNTEYVYRLVNGETISDIYSFKTGNGGDFSFLLAGDPQIGSSGNVTNDTAGWEDTLTKAVAKFPNAEFLISAGDQVETNNNETQYAGYLEHATLKSLPVATVVGNHDSGNSAYREHFNNPNETIDGTVYGETAAGSDYWYVYNNVLFLNMNSNNLSTAEHKEFLKKAIEQNPDVDWKVVIFHHSIFSVASHAYDNDILSRREQYVPMFTELGIDVVLMGHDHVYVRSYMMDGLTPEVTEQVESSVTDPDGILYVTVNSASGSKYYNIKDEQFDYAAVKSQEKTPNISNVEVTENSFKITTYRTSDMSEVDSFTILRTPEIAGTTQTDATETKTEGYNNEEASLAIEKTGTYISGVVNADGGSAEIVQYNSDTQEYYVVNGTSGTLDIVPRAFYEEGNADTQGIKLNLKRQIEKKLPGFQYGDMTSVAVNTEKDLIAVAVQAKGTNDNGVIVFLNYDYEIVGTAKAGKQPDMVTFTEDGNKALAANEGEPREGYGDGTTDPKGSITVVDLSAGVGSATSTDITFDAWDAKRADLVAAGVILKKDTAPSVDLEPEYIAVNKAGTTAYVSLQEANAIATVDLTTNTVTAIRSLGFKDHSLEKKALDMTKDGKIQIQTENVYGVYMPDGISVMEVNGRTYILTANEGDSREWEDYLNEEEIKINGEKVVTFMASDYDGLEEGKTYLFGGRSFAIYDAETMEQIYESGSDFEEKTAEYLSAYFNCSNDKITLDNRSGKKGPESESVIVGQVGEKTYAFIGLERIGGVMIYDVTDPANSTFVNYINSRDFSDKIAGDVSPEGLCFIPASASMSGSPELLVANEVSGTVALYKMTAKAEQNPDEEDKEDEIKKDPDNGDANVSKPGEETQNGQNKGNTVQTGDTTNVMLWSVLLLAAAAALVVALGRKRKTD